MRAELAFGLLAMVGSACAPAAAVPVTVFETTKAEGSQWAADAALRERVDQRLKEITGE
jgi:hypothetical protein